MPCLVVLAEPYAWETLVELAMVCKRLQESDYVDFAGYTDFGY
jgi:hypothetical protein